MSHELDFTSFFVTLEKRLPLSKPIFLSVKMKQQNTSRSLPALRFYVWITLTSSCSHSVIYSASICSEPAEDQASARSRDAGSDNKMRTWPTGNSGSNDRSLSCECRDDASEEPLVAKVRAMGKSRVHPFPAERGMHIQYPGAAASGLLLRARPWCPKASRKVTLDFSTCPEEMRTVP